MKYLLVFLVFLTSRFDLIGQEKTDLRKLNSILPTALQENVRELREHEVDTIYTYFRYCTGCEMPFETVECKGFLDARVVWRKGGKTYSKQVDCKNTEVGIKVSASHALDYFIKHSAEVATREPIREVKGENGITKIFMPYLGPVHHFGEQFTLIVKDVVFSTSLTEYLKENADKTNYGWVKATKVLAELNREEEKMK